MLKFTRDFKFVVLQDLCCSQLIILTFQIGFPTDGKLCLDSFWKLEGQSPNYYRGCKLEGAAPTNVIQKSKGMVA